jgi:hypothetical protein
LSIWTIFLAVPIRLCHLSRLPAQCNEDADEVSTLVPKYVKRLSFPCLLRGVWDPIVLIVGALLALYQSFLRLTVVTIKTSKYNRSISIRKLDKKGDTGRLIPFLKSKDVLVFDKRDTAKHR